LIKGEQKKICRDPGCNHWLRTRQEQDATGIMGIMGIMEIMGIIGIMGIMATSSYRGRRCAA
jgi:hypothetical protein